jgi:hypothetical protein
MIKIVSFEAALALWRWSLSYFSLGAMASMRFSFLLAASVLIGTASSWATSNHQYGADEYDTVINGISPNEKFAITAHGGGEYGYDDFHLYLTDVHSGRNLAVLKEVVETLDTGANAFAAKWSTDSTNVTIVYRIDRHEPLKAVSYRIADDRAQRTKGPFDVKSEALMKYWQKYGSGTRKSPKIFGTPVKHYEGT